MRFSWSRLLRHQQASIAQRVGLSETAFVSESACASLKVEFYTPTRQIPHCGHATVASFALCHELGRLPDGVHTKESIDGILTLELAAGRVTLHQPFPSFEQLAWDSHVVRRATQAIGTTLAGLASAPVVGRAGNAFLLLPLTGIGLLAALQPRFAEIAAVSEAMDVVGLYPYVATEAGATTRMFAPRYGIDEESATGTAAGPLGALLLTANRAAGPCWIEQGRFMTPSSPSRIEVVLANDQVHVSGRAQLGEIVAVETE